MTLKLVCKTDTRVPIELEWLTPDAVRNLSLAEIQCFEVFLGNRKLPLGELFDVSGSAADGRMEFEGPLTAVHWIGAHMKSGEIHVHGDAGRHVGSQMEAGTIEVHGHAGDWVGGEMRGGHIHVHGNAGHLIGAAYRGSRRGMTGGTILVDGDAGNEIGHTMRRGTIAVGGNAADMLAFNMLAGSVLVFGQCGIRPGAGMRRGSVFLLGDSVPALLPTFRYACTYQPPILPLMLRWLRSRGFAWEESLAESPCELFHGDMLEQGRGEILTRSLSLECGDLSPLSASQQRQSGDKSPHSKVGKPVS